uniref:Uncharacterized protein n=1 Tax=Varanus komodoensis TaxID=61221 RepID=A0A8D2LAN6_VARKO
MEQEKSFKFKLFVPPRLSNTQISAVKPQTNTQDGDFFQVNIVTIFNKYIFIYYSNTSVLKEVGKSSIKLLI